MSTRFDPVGFAKTIAEIACKSKEPETAQQLMALVTQLLEAGGLPPEPTPRH